jgi:hypothetical protein
MKSLSSALLAEKGAAQTASCIAVSIATTTPTRLCNWDVAVTYDSNTYSGGVPISRPRIRNGLTGEVKIGNVDDTFTSLVLNGTLKKKDITIYEIYFDDANAVVDAEQLFSGSIDGQALDDQWCTLTLVPANDGAVVLCPRRRIVPSCGLVFKGAECGYSGSETTCAKTYDGCRNSGAPFGGFRFVPKPGKVFSWGKTIITVE